MTYFLLYVKMQTSQDVQKMFLALGNTADFNFVPSGASKLSNGNFEYLGREFDNQKPADVFYYNGVSASFFANGMNCLCILCGVWILWVIVHTVLDESLLSGVRRGRGL